VTFAPHVLIVYDGLPPYRKGGAETRLGVVARGLVERGWRVSWIGLAPEAAPAQQWVDGVCYRAIGREGPAREGGRRGLLATLLYCLRLLRCPLPAAVDCVVLGQIPWLHFFIIRWRLPRGTPILVDCWEIWGPFWRAYYGSLLGFLGQGVERAVLRKATRLTSLSGQTRGAILSHGIGRDKIVDAPNGVDLGLVETLRAERNPFEIAYFGRLVPHKNVDLLIAAFREVAEAAPAASLVIIGDGCARPALEALSVDLGIASRIQFLGELQDHAEALTRLKSASICVQPSTSEGGGSVAVHEANACGLPVIAFRHPQGIDPGLITPGVNGFWLDDIGPHSLARQLIELLNDGPLLERLRQGSRETTMHLDWSRTVAAFDGVLRQLAMQARREESPQYMQPSKAAA
jgi:glycosyltransferase involved in cell wall biosynthesis